VYEALEERREGMNKDIKRLKDKIDNIAEKLVLFPYPYNHLVDCRIDFGLKLNPLVPMTATQAIHLEQMETRLKASIYEDLKHIEAKINNYLRLGV